MRTKIYRQREYIGDLLSPRDRAELIEQAHREAEAMKTTAIETTFSCGHTEIMGGNPADPMFIYADFRSYVSKPDLCAMCSNPEKYKPSSDSPLEKASITL